MTDSALLFREYQQKILSPDKQVRLEAVRQISGHNDPRAIRMLLSALSDNSAAVREEISRLILQMEHPSIVPGLVALLDSEIFHVRTSARNILVSIPESRTISELCRFALDPSTESGLVREILPLIARSELPEAREITQSSLKHAGPEQKKNLLEGLASNQSDWAIDSILEETASQDHDIRARAISILSSRYSESLTAKLLTLIQKQGIQGAGAVEILSRMNRVIPPEPVLAASESSSEEIRQRALLLINLIPAADASKVASMHLDSFHTANRFQAVDYFKTKGASFILSIVDESTRLDDPFWTESVAELLAGFDSPAHYASLEKLFGRAPVESKRVILKVTSRTNPSAALKIISSFRKLQEIQPAIIECLEMIPREESLLILLELMVSTSHTEQARQTLLRWSPPILEKLLIQIFKSQNSAFQQTILSLLARIKSDKGFELMLGMPSESAMFSFMLTPLGELYLRRKLHEKNWDASGQELLDLETIAISNGWKNTSEILPVWIHRIGRWVHLEKERADLRKTLGSHADTYPEKEGEQKPPPSGTMLIRLQLLLIAVCVFSLAGTAVSLYMTWRPMAASYWFPLLVLFAVTLGVGFIFLNNVSQTRARRDVDAPVSRQTVPGKTGHPRKTQDVKKQLKTIEDELRKPEFKDLQSKIVDFIQAVTSQPAS